MPRTKVHEKICVQCQSVYNTKNPNGRYCSPRCRGLGSVPYHKPASEEQRKAQSEKLKARYKDKNERARLSAYVKQAWKDKPERFARGERLSKAVGKGTKGKYNKKIPDSIFKLSTRTVRKILTRLGDKIKCCICGWSEGTCDIHHINGRKIKNPHCHTNLTILCPNCHRLAHEKKIEKSTLINIQDLLGDTWKEFYYG